MSSEVSHRTRACPVCGGASAQPLLTNRMVPVDGLDMSYRIARCDGCGFHFADWLPVNASYGRYYAELSKYDSQPSVSPVDRQRIEAALAVCKAHIDRSARIVDLGCGFGALLAALRDAGWTRVEGLDPAPQSARQAMAQFGLGGIQCGNLQDAPARMDLQHADLVCLMAVAEHLPDLKADLAPIVAAMRPGARLLVETPALEGFDPDKGEPFGELSMEHIQFFSLASLRRLLRGLGLRIVDERVVAFDGIEASGDFVLAEVTHQPESDGAKEPAEPFDAYLAGSERRLRQALQRLPDQPFVLYGAGSHSARLIPRLGDKARHIAAVVDGNANLHGKRFGEWTVQAPDALPGYAGLPIVISSFRAEQAIARSLRERLQAPELVLLYA